MKGSLVLGTARLLGALYPTRPSPMAEMARAFSRTMAAALGPPEVGTERWIRETEHELMIAGHETGCGACAQAARERYTVNGIVWAPGSAMDEWAPWYAAMVRDQIDKGANQ